MKKFYEDKRTMCYVVKDFISTVSGSILDGMPDFNAVYAAFVAELETLPQESESQFLNRTGQATLKGIYKMELAALAVDVSSRIKGYAANTNNVPLMAEMTLSFSVLYKMKDTLCADACNLIRLKGEELLGSLGPYGVTEEMLLALKDKRIAYLDQLPKPRIGIMERKRATRAIAESMFLLSGYLNRMDTLVHMMAYQLPDFYNSYFSARRIVSSGHRTLSILGRVMDSQGVPLTKVEVLLKDSTLIKKSGTKGGFEFKNLESKVYEVILRKAGFMDVVVKVAVTATERTRVTVVMEQDLNNPLRLAS